MDLYNLISDISVGIGYPTFSTIMADEAEWSSGHRAEEEEDSSTESESYEEIDDGMYMVIKKPHERVTSTRPSSPEFIPSTALFASDESDSSESLHQRTSGKKRGRDGGERERPPSTFMMEEPLAVEDPVEFDYDGGEHDDDDDQVMIVDVRSPSPSSLVDSNSDLDSDSDVVDFTKRKRLRRLKKRKTNVVEESGVEEGERAVESVLILSSEEEQEQKSTTQPSIPTDAATAEDVPIGATIAFIPHSLKQQFASYTISKRPVSKRPRSISTPTSATTTIKSTLHRPTTPTALNLRITVPSCPFPTTTRPASAPHKRPIATQVIRLNEPVTPNQPSAPPPPPPPPVPRPTTGPVPDTQHFLVCTICRQTRLKSCFSKAQRKQKNETRRRCKTCMHTWNQRFTKKRKKQPTAS